MSDYEMIMIFLTILSLLILASHRNDRYMRTAAQLQLHGGSLPLTH